WTWLTDREGGIALALTALAALAALVALVILARFIRSVSRRGFARIEGLSMVLQNFLAAAVFWLVLASGLIVAFSLIGLDITPLFALIGAASFILAFAFQDTLGNIASGIMIMINRPFDVGDTVDLDGVTGKVESFSIIATRIVTFDNQVIVIPNRNVWGNIIRNMTATSTRRVDLVFGIGYGDSIEDAQAVLEEIVRAHPGVLEEPEPVVRVHELGENSVNFICRPWVRTEDYWAVHWDLTSGVKQAFDERGISIPFPQRDLHLHLSKDEDAALSAAGGQ
ncbi:mechanosensitive ion channel family protein, partial [Erythrobacter sp.]|uniref:mechanosensitive ion channel family protein n=1 Tax=Erythrobacter sp. TaxID=1042 RepID=UPI002EB45AF5|nr:mechanosensitive ion channel family protein [Erythrobacter sp.]